MSHCLVGYNIVKGIEFPWSVADIILQHHERMNGSGLPIWFETGGYYYRSQNTGGSGCNRCHGISSSLSGCPGN